MKTTYAVALLIIHGLLANGFAQVVVQRTVQKPDETVHPLIAITIDDLPVVSTRHDIANRREITKKLLAHISEYNAPVTGFVNEQQLYTDGKLDNDQVDLLKQWLSAGLDLGNHTYSHKSLNTISLADYEADLLAGEKVIRPLVESYGRRLRYFRHPFLHTGRTPEVKEQFAKFLTDHGYRIAPVTIDNADYIFSNAYDRAYDSKDKKLMKKIGEAYVPYMAAKMAYWEKQSAELLGRDVREILLIHANFINSVYLGDLLEMLKERGYVFVTLDQALKDEAYDRPDDYFGPAGISWLHRWAMSKGKKFVVANEPTVPDFVLKASVFDSE